jgi:alkylation response protein AidB-like acyl-CoA dehydrogenase
MFFGFDDDQIALREAVAGLLAKRAGVPSLEQAWADPSAAAPWSVWADLAEMGVQGLMAPESAGGSGMDWVPMALVLAEAGRVAMPLPLAETAAIGVPLLAAAGDPAGAIPGLVDGSAVLTAAAGPDALAPAASRADWFLLGRPGPEGGAVLYRRDEVEVEAVASVDRTRDTARVTPSGDGIVIPAGPVALGDLGALAAAAVLIGLGRALVSLTVGYVKDRKQFGVPVGSFQAVKHQLADAAMHVEFAAPTVWAAAWELTLPNTGSAPRSISLAKAMASDAADRAARTALQCHGAMGYTDDYPLHMWLKRVWCLAPAYGSAVWHRARIGADLGLAR